MDTFTADDGERLHLRIAGNGIPVLFLHGWTSSHAVWNPLLPTLTAGYQVFCPDARCHGGHDTLVTTQPSIKRLARDVLNLIDHYGLNNLAVVGHSMGALTLWQFIRDYGCARLSHLCIIDQSPKLVTDTEWAYGIYGDFDAIRSQQLITEMQVDFAEAVMRLAAYGLNARALNGYERNSAAWQALRRYLHALKPGPLIAIWESLVDADLRDVLPQITIPTLVVWGSESNFYIPGTAKYLRDHIACCRVIRYPAADHSPQLQYPDRFVSELHDFLGGLGMSYSASTIDRDTQVAILGSNAMSDLVAMRSTQL
ncbi:MAG: alpha/beta hydrolase [Rhodoferax sp.]|nr:alpha/beta hydrolase [Rhodoferax sp.]